MNSTSTTPSRPWYREPMMWMVVTLPAVTVVAGLATVVIAYRGGDAVVVDDYRKEGIAINRDPARDEAAAKLGVTARVSDTEGALTVRLDGAGAEPPRKLVVILSHATRAELDQMLTLERRADGHYAAPLTALNPGHWYVEISPTDRAWRLTGEFVDRAPALDLRPAAAAPSSP